MSLVGKRVQIEIACVDPAGRELDRFRTAGTIETVGEHRIGVRRPGLAELFGLPPDPALLQPAAPGADADLVATLTVTCNDPDSLLELRGLGYVP